MKSLQQHKIIKGAKRLSALLAIGIWIVMMYRFLTTPAPFADLVPYCMGSTMLLFGIVTGIFKGLEYWEIKMRNEE